MLYVRLDLEHGLHDTEVEQNTWLVFWSHTCCMLSAILDVLNKLRIEIGESVELRLVQVHHEELVGWR